MDNDNIEHLFKNFDIDSEKIVKESINEILSEDHQVSAVIALLQFGKTTFQLLDKYQPEQLDENFDRAIMETIWNALLILAPDLDFEVFIKAMESMYKMDMIMHAANSEEE